MRKARDGSQRPSGTERAESTLRLWILPATLVAAGMVTSPHGMRYWVPRRSARAKACLGRGLGSLENVRMGPERLSG